MIEFLFQTLTNDITTLVFSISMIYRTNWNLKGIENWLRLYLKVLNTLYLLKNQSFLKRNVAFNDKIKMNITKDTLEETKKCRSDLTFIMFKCLICPSSSVNHPSYFC